MIVALFAISRGGRSDGRTSAGVGGVVVMALRLRLAVTGRHD